MKKLTIFAAVILAVMITMIITMLVMMFDVIPSEFTAFVVVFLVVRYAVPMALIALVAYGLWLAFNAYANLAEAERSSLNGVVCPVIDAGLHEAKKRTDRWGKAAKWIRLYRRFARKYPH